MDNERVATSEGSNPGLKRVVMGFFNFEILETLMRLGAGEIGAMADGGRVSSDGA